MSNNEKRTLLFLSDDDIKTLVDALINAYGTADVYARSMTLQYNAKVEELDEAKQKLEKAEARLTVMDAAYADLDDERAAWKEKYDKLVASINAKCEREGK